MKFPVDVVFVKIVQSILVVASVVSFVVSVFTNPTLSTSCLTLCVLSFGTAAFILSFKLGRARQKDDFGAMHKFIHRIRDYNFFKRQKKNISLTYQDMTGRIHDLVNTISDNLEKRYNLKVCCTLKILDNKNKYLHVFRCQHCQQRKQEKELVKESPIYNGLISGKAKKYIYVEDIKNEKYIDKHPFLDGFGTDGKAKASLKLIAGQSGYRSFMAIPIKQGCGEMTLPLGFLGVDHKTVDFLKDFEGRDVEYLACIVDLLAEVAFDFTKAEEPTKQQKGGAVTK